MAPTIDHTGADYVQPGPPAGASLSAQPHEVVLEAVREASEPSRVYWLMNALATVIACYGLFTNSPAVVIGSMVVAMLLGPISGVALGLNNGNWPLLRTALFSLVGGIIWILAIATVVGLIHRDVPLTSQILSRTTPDLFELIIALASGAAGAVAVLSPRIGTAIVGVAVATALVPPLAAAGILLARADFALAGGALLLALTNVAAIQVAFSTIFWSGGYRKLTAIGDQGFLAYLRRDVLSLGLVCVLAVAFGIQLHNTIKTSLFESKVRAILRQYFSESSGFYLVDVRLASDAHAPVVRAVVRGPRPPSPEKVAEAQAALPRPRNGTRLKLRVRFVDTVILTPQGPLPGDDEP
ncbi:MAG: TIGR00341 family protein [Methylovirgula sp.]